MIPRTGGRYEASTEGGVRRAAGARFARVVFPVARSLKAKIDRDGYPVFGLKIPGKARQEWRAAHTWVMRAFAGFPLPGQDVCHNNSTRSDSRFWNLRYDTRHGNFLDRSDVQPEGFGARVRKAAQDGESQASIARRSGVGPSHVSRIVNGLRRKED
jgi:hypothetical protein